MAITQLITSSRPVHLKPKDHKQHEVSICLYVAVLYVAHLHEELLRWSGSFRYVLTKCLCVQPVPVHILHSTCNRLPRGHLMQGQRYASVSTGTAEPQPPSGPRQLMLPAFWGVLSLQKHSLYFGNTYKSLRLVTCEPMPHIACCS